MTIFGEKVWDLLAVKRLYKIPQTRGFMIGESRISSDSVGVNSHARKLQN